MAYACYAAGHHQASSLLRNSVDAQLFRIYFPNHSHLYTVTQMRRELLCHGDESAHASVYYTLRVNFRSIYVSTYAIIQILLPVGLPARLSLDCPRLPVACGMAGKPTVLIRLDSANALPWFAYAAVPSWKWVVGRR